MRRDGTLLAAGNTKVLTVQLQPTFKVVLLFEHDAPSGYYVATDAQGNLFFSNAALHTVSKRTPGGSTSVLAGVAGELNFPTGLAFAPGGTLYVADSGNHRIRKIDSTGKVSTFAGGDSPGYKDGVGTEAKFNIPQSLAFAPDGTLYVADIGNYRIRKIDSTGKVSTFVGDGTSGSKDGMGQQAQLWGPIGGLAVDEAGNLYISDSNKIRKVSKTGAVSTLAGSDAQGSRDGPGARARFSIAGGLAIGKNGAFLYVLDSGNTRIRRIGLK